MSDTLNHHQPWWSPLHTLIPYKYKQKFVTPVEFSSSSRTQVLPEPGWECSSTVVLPKVEGSRYRTDTGHAEGDDGTAGSIGSAIAWPTCADCACSSTRRSGGRRRDTRGGELMGIGQRSVVPGYSQGPYLTSLPCRLVFFFQGVGRLCPVRPFGWPEVEHAWAVVFSPCFLSVFCVGSTHGDREAPGLALLSPPQRRRADQQPPHMQTACHPSARTPL